MSGETGAGTRPRCLAVHASTPAHAVGWVMAERLWARSIPCVGSPPAERG